MPLLLILKKIFIYPQMLSVARTELNSVSIGDITVYNVRANLNPGMNGEQILLGMSVLKQLEFTQRGEWLILRTL